MDIAQIAGRGAAIVGKAMSGISATKSSGGKNPYGTNFIDLLVSQITHQNPLEPMDNETMVTQMTQMQTMEKMEQLDNKMGTLMIYQNLMNSINLMGKRVTVVDPASGEEITGMVEGIRIENGFPGVVVGDKFYDITSVRGIN